MNRISNFSLICRVDNYEFDETLKEFWYVEVNDELKRNLFRTFNKLQFESGKKVLDNRYETPDFQKLQDDLLNQISLLPNPVSLLIDVKFFTCCLYKENKAEYAYDQRELLLTFPLRGRLYGTSIGVLVDAENLESEIESYPNGKLKLEDDE